MTMIAGPKFELLGGSLKNDEWLCEHAWRSHMTMLETKTLSLVLYQPPSLTFSSKTTVKLRSSKGPGRYGAKNLKYEHKEMVRKETLHAVNVARALGAHIQHRIPFMLITSRQRLLRLDEYRESITHPEVRHVNIDLCTKGSRTRKPLTIVSFLVSDSESLIKSQSCNHSPTSWTQMWSGNKVYQPHPPGRRCDEYIISELWDENMKDVKPPRPQPHDQDSAPALDEDLAKVILETILEPAAQKISQEETSHNSAQQDGRSSHNENSSSLRFWFNALQFAEIRNDFELKFAETTP